MFYNINKNFLLAIATVRRLRSGRLHIFSKAAAAAAAKCDGGYFENNNSDNNNFNNYYTIISRCASICNRKSNKYCDCCSMYNHV